MATIGPRAGQLKIQGATDDTLIGNIGNSLKVHPAQLDPQNGGVIDALNDAAIYSNIGFGCLVIQGIPSASPAWSGTLVVEGSTDGTNYEDLAAIQKKNGDKYVNIVAGGIYTIDATGLTHVKVRCSAYTAGTMTILFTGSLFNGRAGYASLSQRVLTSGVNSTQRYSVIETEHQKIHEQKLFHFSEVAVLSSGATRYFLFEPTTYTAHWIFTVHGQDGVKLDLYELPDLTGITAGAALPAYNKARFGAAAPPLGTIKIATVVPTLPAYLQTFDTGSASNIQKAIGRSSEWDLSTAKKYLFRVTSNNAGNTITTEMEWYEN